MRLPALLLPLILAGSLAVPVAAQYRSTPDQEAAVGIRMAAVLEAWSSSDFQTRVRPFYDAKGEIFFDISPLAFHSLDEYIAYVAKTATHVQSFKLVERDPPVIHLTGPDSAWGAGTITVTITAKDGAVQTFAGRWTSVWLREQGQWKIVHEHYSFPAPND